MLDDSFIYEYPHLTIKMEDSKTENHCRKCQDYISYGVCFGCFGVVVTEIAKQSNLSEKDIWKIYRNVKRG